MNPEKAKKILKEYIINNNLNASDAEFDVYIVWQCKALQNWKFLLSSTIADGRYYELTYNGDKNESYLDVYIKEDNVKTVFY